MIAALQISTVFIGAGLGPWAAGLLSDAYGGPHSLSQALMTTAPILLVAIGLYLMAARRVTLSGVS
jgi:cyanate permease